MIKLLLHPLFLFAANPTELKIAINAEFDTLNPIISSMMASSNIQDTCLRPLIGLNRAGQAVPILIEDLPTVDNKMVTRNSLDNSLSVKVKIRKNANWGDGVPVTCQDLQASWKIGLNENVSTPNREEYDNISKISSLSDKECVILFKKAKWDYYLNIPKPIPSHIELPIFERFKDKSQAYERNSKFVTDITNPGLYNGPYRVTQLKLGSHVVLEPNEKFYGSPAKIKKIIFKVVSNSATMEANLRSGSVDMLSSSGLTFDQALAFEKKAKNETLPYQVNYEPGPIYSHLDLNLDHKILKDLEIRKALLLAINREEMAQAFFEGKQKAALHFAMPSDDWFSDKKSEISITPFSMRDSQKLLEKNGWKLGPDGYRYKEGQKLSFQITGGADIKLNEMIQNYIQDSFKKVGVELVIKNYPARILFGEILRKRNYEISLYSWVSNPNSSQRSVLHSSMIPTAANSWSGANRTGWKNAMVDEALDQVDIEFDKSKRIKLMKKVLKAYTEEIPSIPLYYRSNNAVIPKSLEKFEMTGHIYSEYLAIENWQVQ